MRASRKQLLEGWPFLGMACLAILIVIGLAALAGGGDIDAIRLAIRSTARTSIVFFLLAFTASAAHTLVPTPLTSWQLRNRRYLGLAFAFSHIVHAAAIITLARVDPQLLWTLTNVGSIFSGGLAYVFIMLMAATSFDRAVTWIGPARWRLLHKAGVWFVWISFMVAFGKRIPVSPAYWLPVVMLMLALALRTAARLRRRRNIVATG